MKNHQQQLAKLIDVIALSRNLCARPIRAHLVYATPENFIASIVDGYTPGLTDLALMTKESAIALCEVQNDLLKNHDLGLLVYDSYRPRRAVQHFVRWSTQAVGNDEQGRYELQRKTKHYPNIEKGEMFKRGYVAEDSQHCYGHTVDLVLVDRDGRELEHGACYDFMDSLSHLVTSADEIGETAVKNRQILSTAMQKFGFIPYAYEYWHFSFKEKSIHEPMDFVIGAELKGLNVG